MLILKELNKIYEDFRFINTYRAQYKYKLVIKRDKMKEIKDFQVSRNEEVFTKLKTLIDPEATDFKVISFDK